MTGRVPAPVLCAFSLALVVSCSTAPKATDTITVTKRQAAQDAATGESYYRQGRYELAMQFYSQSLSEYASVDAADGVIQSYNGIGRTYAATGDLDAAEGMFTRAREKARGASPGLLLVSLINLGEISLARGDPQKAQATFEEAMAVPAGAATTAQTAVIYHDMGTARKDQQDPAGALEYFGKALAINLAGKLAAEAASDYYMIASVHSKQGDYAAAQKNAELALSLDKQVENSPGIASDLYALGLIANRKKDSAAAYDYFQRSYLVSTTLGMRAERIKALTALIAAADALGMGADAGGYRETLAGLEKQ